MIFLDFQFDDASSTPDQTPEEEPFEVDRAACTPLSLRVLFHRHITLASRW
jgi:hypothetical protein